jgi:hypothetical protein
MNGKIYEGSQLLGDVGYMINSTLEVRPGMTMDNEIIRAAGFRALQGKLKAEPDFLNDLFRNYDNRFLLELENGNQISIALSSTKGTFQSKPPRQ